MTGRLAAPERRTRPLTFVDVFAGAGGLSLGLMRAGWRGLFALERDKHAFETLQHNLIEGHCGQQFDWPAWLSKRPWEIGAFLRKHESEIEQLRGKVDLLAGGPPCQGFSPAGLRKRSDPRNQLFRHYVQLAAMLVPTFLFFENVAFFDIEFDKQDRQRKNPRRLGRPAKAFSKLLGEALSQLGYQCFGFHEKAMDFGVPQARPRYVLFCVRADVDAQLDEGDFRSALAKSRRSVLAPLGLPLDRPITVAEAISDLETSGKGLVDCDDFPGFNQIEYKGPATAYQRAMRRGVYDGQVPNSLRLPRHRQPTIDRFKTIQETCRKGVALSRNDRDRLGIKKTALIPLAADKPSHTLTSLPDDFLHYSEPRILTVREYARLQSFPDNYAFKGQYTTGGKHRRQEVPRYTQVANAVPPLLGEAVGRSLRYLARAVRPEAGAVAAPAALSKSIDALARRDRTKHRPHAPVDCSGVAVALVDEFRNHVAAWFKINQRSFPWRRDNASLYERVVSEVLLQQTPASRVAAFLPGFLNDCGDWSRVAEASEEELGERLKPLGLWRRRAPVLSALASHMVRRDGRYPSDRDDAESLPAVGQYVASAVLLFAGGQAEPLLDTNMARVLERYFGPRAFRDIRHDPYLQALAREVVSRDPIETNWAILDLAALVCRPRSPRCTACPLASTCRFAGNATEQ